MRVLSAQITRDTEAEEGGEEAENADMTGWLEARLPAGQKVDTMS